jgi:hypothetical protein
MSVQSVETVLGASGILISNVYSVTWEIKAIQGGVTDTGDGE